MSKTKVAQRPTEEKPKTAPLTLADIEIVFPEATNQKIVVPGQTVALILAMVYERTTRNQITDELNLIPLVDPDCLAHDLEGLTDLLNALAWAHDEEMLGPRTFDALQVVAEDLTARMWAARSAKHYAQSHVRIVRAQPAAGGAR